jgi:hypothetical protein
VEHISTSEYPVPVVKAQFHIGTQYIGEPGLYIHIERPELPRYQFQRSIVHYKDILLNHLPNPTKRANYVFSQACESGLVDAAGGGPVSRVFLAQLEKPEVTPVLLLWEKRVIECHPCQGELVETVGAIYGKSLPRADWELHYFLVVWNRLLDLCKLTDFGAFPGQPLYFIARGSYEFAEGARLVHKWYKEYRLYVELVQFHLRLEPGQSRCVLDRFPSWKEVEDLRLEPQRLFPEYFQMCTQLEQGQLGPLRQLQRMTWEELQEMEMEWLVEQNRPPLQAGRIRPAQ